MAKELDILIGIKEENLSELLKYHSARNSFNVNTYTATSGEQLKYKINNFEYDGIISDYDLVDRTAVDILKDVEMQIPFIIHTWYYKKILEKKALEKGAFALVQKKRHLSYFNELVYKISKHSNSDRIRKNERPDLKIRINSKGRILQMNGLPQKALEDIDRVSDLSPFIDQNQVEEAIRETFELGDSSLEAIMEDRQGLVNYSLFFTELENAAGISVTALPEQELQYIDKEVYAKLSDSAGQEVRD